MTRVGGPGGDGAEARGTNTELPRVSPGPTLAGLDAVGPFGTPDGARADFDRVVNDFVDFEGNPAYGALATRSDDAAVRVIVGRLGAGKTVYMRRLSDFQAHEPSVYAVHPQQNLPATEVIVRASDWFERLLTERWIQLWGRAILRALATHLLTAPELASQVPVERQDEIRRDYGHLLGDFKRPRTIYSELTNIVNSHNTENHVVRYLEDPAWDDLEDVLSDTLRETRPVFFYLDAVDETFINAPAYWLRCQEGLFLQVMRLLRNPKFGGRLHLVVCIRDIVLSSIYRSEHASRYQNEPHIRVLSWDRESIEYLLMHKLDRLTPEFLMHSGNLHSRMDAWLGAQWIYNERRAVDENLVDYILRHTRLIPRDVVTMGNALCMEVLRQKQAGRSEIPHRSISAVVSLCAKRFGDVQLAQCAAHIAAGMMPRHAVNRNFSDGYLDNQELVDELRKGVKKIIRTVGRDRFDPAALAGLREQGQNAFDGRTDLAAVLWQGGLLGSVDREGQARFYSIAEMDEFDLPEDCAEYVFHPCVLDSVQGMAAIGRPVLPYQRE